MKTTVAILGGGAVGTSIAYHLSRAFRGTIYLFDAGEIGAGSTVRSAGGVRSLFEQSLETKLSRYSREAFRRLETMTSRSLGFQTCGYLMLASSDRLGRALNRRVECARAHDIQVETVPISKVSTLVPGINTEGVVKAVLSPEDGYMQDPQAAALAYAELAARQGVRIIDHTPIVSVAQSREGFALQAQQHIYSADQIIIALNAYAGPILDSLGVHLACFPYPRHTFNVSPPPSALSPDMPLTIFQDEDLMFRHDGAALLSICGQREQSTMDTSYDLSRLDEVGQRIARRLDLGQSEVSLAWSGLRSLTPDRRALVGAVPGVTGAWCAIGFSGHGLMHAPAVGLAITEMVQNERNVTFDVSELDPDRWQEIPSEPPILEPEHR